VADVAAIRRQAQHAGRLYLLTVFIAPFGLLYVPGVLIVPGDAAATASRIREAEWLLRVAIGSEVLQQLIAVFVVLALYRLFKPVDERLATLLVVLGMLLSVPITLYNVVNELAVILIVRAPAFLKSAFEPQQLDALAYLFLRLHARGLDIAGVFWGLWLFPFGRLVERSGWIPRWLGQALYVGGAGYLLNAFAVLMLPPSQAAALKSFASVLYLCELPIIVWLAVWGARESRAVRGG
jgi:hypothetical protein